MIVFGSGEFYTASDVWSRHEIVVDQDGRRFELMEDGTVDFTCVSGTLLRQQSQYGSRYVDGILSDYPYLGSDLEFTDGNDGPVDSCDYHRIGILAEDIPVFVGRVLAYRTLKTLSVVDEEGRRNATSDEIADAAAYLTEQGFGDLAARFNY